MNTNFFLNKNQLNKINTKLKSHSIMSGFYRLKNNLFYLITTLSVKVPEGVSNDKR